MSNEAERSFIAGILNQSELLKDYELKPDDFIGFNNRCLFQCIVDMSEKDQFIDCSTFIDYLGIKHPEDNRLFSHAVDIMAGFASLAGMDNYVKAILRDSQGAKLAHTLRELALMADDFGAYDEKMGKVLDSLSELREPEQKDLVDLNTSLSAFVPELERRGNVQGMDGMATGFQRLDERFMGFKGGNLIIIAGRPSMGKTTLALNITDRSVMRDETVLFFSREMSSLELIDKTVSHLSGVPLKAIKTGQLQDEHWPSISQAVFDLKEKKLFIDESSKSVQKISVIAKKKKLREGLDLIVIDYLQLLDGVGDNRTAQIGSITRGLKSLAKELDIPIILLSQLSREVEKRPDKRPMMSDLRDSGEIEQDADIVIFVYRDEVYYDDEPLNKGIAEIITAKFRNGSIGKDLLSSNFAISRFGNLAACNYQPHQNRKSTKKGFNND